VAATRPPASDTLMTFNPISVVEAAAHGAWRRKRSPRNDSGRHPRALGAGPSSPITFTKAFEEVSTMVTRADGSGPAWPLASPLTRS
jgi:hypothetical protein